MPLAPPFCIACRAPAGRQLLCASCRRALEWLREPEVAVQGLRVWAPVRYEGPARAMVQRLKLHAAPALAGQMAAMIVATAPPELLDAPLVPVPGRGHAECLAKALSRRTGLRRTPLLERTGGRRQVGRSRASRLREPPRFSALRPGHERVVLIDDVVTTGATLSACASALRQAGWSCGAALVFARTPVR